MARLFKIVAAQASGSEMTAGASLCAPSHMTEDRENESPAFADSLRAIGAAV